MALNLVKIGVTAGFVLATGGYSLWRYRRQIEKLLTDFIEWVNVKITHVANYAKEMLRGLAVATKNIVHTATESLRRRWNSMSPESRGMVTEATNKVIQAGISAALDVAEENIRQLFPENSLERKVFNDVKSGLQRLQNDINGSVTRCLI
ncbi:uncharacterized protein LOC132743388 [Ruditapes philippinarum]|uniref:uncharacterized protein LOC132743388 n=1 Tax=Ruditapes philippinarum TaxID=129788 RepID=UPI00295A974B|nr:uncharacterized protein LOC132743388 [Ruditapes philippinarum]